MRAVLRRSAAPALSLLLLLVLAWSGGRTILVNTGMDLLFRARGAMPPDQRIVIVGVDDATLAAYGRWPLPRRLHAELLGRLAGARALGLDFLFSEAAADDALLSAALASGPPAVLAVAPDGRQGLLKPHSGISGYAGLGHIEAMLSGDGIVRQVRLSPLEEVPLFAASLASVAGLGKALDTGSHEPRFINFYGPESTFLTLSYRDVLEGKYPDTVFAGRFVLVGAQALGLGDSYITTFTRKTPTPGIEIQATILSNLLNNSFVRPLPWLTPMLIALFALLPLGLWPALGERRNLLCNLLLTVLVLVAALQLFRRHCFFDYLSPLAFLLFTYLFYLCLELFAAVRHILHQTQMLDQELDERLRLVYHAGQGPSAGHCPFSPAGIQEHLKRLQRVAAALRLQHHFLDNLLNRELPPLILWESGSGEPVFANVAFHAFWRACTGQEGGGLPRFQDFGARIPLKPPEDSAAGAGTRSRFDLQVKMPAGTRDFQGTVHRLLAPESGFCGDLALLQDITEIKELERVKDEVVSIVSHEFKQPLTVILGYGQMLMEELEGANRTFAQKICGQAGRLNRMIRDFLDIARLESGRQQIRRLPFSLEHMVAEALESIQSSAGKKGILVTQEAPEHTSLYSGDEDLLMHALLNLLDNAVKFSDAGTVVKVVLVEEPERFVLRVVDQGPGIPDAERERIFGKFQRGSRTEKDEGFGLGLHLVHQIIEGHGGSIEALAVPVGATFEIVLPKAAAGEGTQTPLA